MVYSKLPRKIDKIFIDLDDTLVDFIGQAAILLGFTGVSTKQSLKKFWNYINEKGMQAELWARLNSAGPEWWANLPKLPWADELMKAANAACKDVIILTSPGRNSGAEIAAHGKLLWTLREYKDNMLILAYKKYMCSSPGALLIDDWNKFTVPWEERGGVALKLRREWHDTGYSPDEIIDALIKYSRYNR
ncbi:MAG: hypothetical protein KAS32_18415 [Candidatus Peribacteraceae bacterium]|nr:hypothetical protein [Candidatus Peribacteraceae bacterium]